MNTVEPPNNGHIETSHFVLYTEVVLSYTVEPPNKGHVGARSFVLYRVVSFIRRLKCTGIIGIGTNRFVLYREVFFIQSVLYQRFHCNREGTSECVLYREIFLLCPLFGVSFIGGSCVCHLSESCDKSITGSCAAFTMITGYRSSKSLFTSTH